MRPEDQAELLRAWLDGDVDHPPDGLDIDVIESIQALRPELAAPPSLTADDILAGLDLAPAAPAVDEPGAEILAFPSAPAAASKPPTQPAVPQPERTSVWAMLGTAGALGLLAAAAAVALVTLYTPASEDSLVAMEMPSEEAADAPSEEAADASRSARPKKKDDTPAAALAAPASKRSEGPADMPTGPAGQGARIAEPGPDARTGGAAPTMAARPAPPATDVETFAPDSIVEHDEEEDAFESLDDEAPAEAAAPAPAPEPEPAPAAAEAEERSVESIQRMAAVAPGRSARRRDAAKSSNTMVEDVESGSVRSDAERLTALVAPPPEVGQLRALEASGLWVELGELERSEAVLRAGLELSQTNTPTRSRLLRALAETLQERGKRREARELRAQADALDAER